MDAITKAVFNNKLNSVTDSVSKNLNFGGDKNEDKDDRHLTSKELRKLEEEEKAERAKRDEIHAKRSDERQRKRDAMRVKYGIEKTDKESGKRQASQGKADQTESNEEKSCIVM